MDHNEIADIREKVDALCASAQELEEVIKNSSIPEFRRAFESISGWLKTDCEFVYKILDLLENNPEEEIEKVLRMFNDLYGTSANRKN